MLTAAFSLGIRVSGLFHNGEVNSFDLATPHGGGKQGGGGGEAGKQALSV